MRRDWIMLALMLLPALAAAEPAMPPPPPPPPDAQPFTVPIPPQDLGKWWKSSEIAGAIGVSAQQVQKIEQIFQEHRLKLIDLNADLQREEARLEPLVEADQPDEAQVGAAIERVAAARGRLEKANALMMLAVRRVLTVEQWHKLEAVKRERQRNFLYIAPPPPPPFPGRAPVDPPNPPSPPNPPAR
jgi:Spy/CpxP family protein refolding chaperone